MSVLRQEKYINWLNGLHKIPVLTHTLKAASSDASFRRYFRLEKANNNGPVILMDAPPPNEDVRPFIHTTALLRDAGVQAPEIYAQDEVEGFLLLQDLGDETFLKALQSNPDRRSALYNRALEVLAQIQAKASVTDLPAYSAEKLMQEMNLFDDWYVKEHCKAELTAQEAEQLGVIKTQLIESALAESQVFVHRDYHSRNLMVLPQALEEGEQQGQSIELGVIDHQDAVVGPVSYDVVSLLRDAYVEWPEEETLDWAIRFWENARQHGVQVPPDPTEFYRQIDFMGLQRHLKVLGIFCRLFYRDGKDQYLKDLRLVMAYVRIVAGRYDQFKPLLRILDRLEGQTEQVGYTF